MNWTRSLPERFSVNACTPELATLATVRRIPALAGPLTTVADRSDLYRKRYIGDYCIGCKQFYGPGELVDGCCPEHGRPTETVGLLPTVHPAEIQ